MYIGPSLFLFAQKRGHHLASREEKTKIDLHVLIAGLTVAGPLQATNVFIPSEDFPNDFYFCKGLKVPRRGLTVFKDLLW